jgi:hypothetical protein
MRKNPSVPKLNLNLILGLRVKPALGKYVGEVVRLQSKEVVRIITNPATRSVVTLEESGKTKHPFPLQILFA